MVTAAEFCGYRGAGSIGVRTMRLPVILPSLRQVALRKNSEQDRRKRRTGILQDLREGVDSITKHKAGVAI